MISKILIVALALCGLVGCTAEGHLYASDGTATRIYLTYITGIAGQVQWTAPSGEVFVGDYDTEDAGQFNDLTLNLPFDGKTKRLLGFEPGHSTGLQVGRITAHGNQGSVVRCVIFANTVPAPPLIHGHGGCIDQKDHVYELYY